MRNAFYTRGEPFIWATGASLALVLAMTCLLVWIVLRNGLGVFWPADLELVELRDGSVVLGERVREEDSRPGQHRIQYKIGNRDLYGLDFRWIDAADIAAVRKPADAVTIERQEYGNFYGFLRGLQLADIPAPAAGPSEWERLQQALAVVRERQQEIETLARTIAAINRATEQIDNRIARLRYQGVQESDPRLQRLLARRQKLQQRFDAAVEEQGAKSAALAANTAVLTDAAGTEKLLPLAEIVRIFRPNQMSLTAKLRYYGARVWELLTAEPRESNTEGGLFPAIFGTVMLVFLMSILSFPLGVIAGIYLREYAREGLAVRLVRIAVNNLAGIPSIVYGIFGLGFFVYGIGATIDQLFFPERLPTPTFGTGGILWASLTLGLLTVPVVIVATEEALDAIPGAIREGSLALGATKFQTLYKLLVPMASPGIMTGFILAMARAAGEVAPLMITGVVKLAPALPLDTTFPYFHLDRKFMHLGFHIYDIGFQSPNVEAAMPMVYVTTLLLLAIVVAMCSIAIVLRNHMKRKYALGSV